MLSPKIDSTQPSSRGQFTFGPHDNHNSSVQPFEVQLSVEHHSTKTNDNKGVLSQFDVIYTLRNPGQEIRLMVEKLDQGYYLCFKYWAITISVLSVIVAIGNLINLLWLESFKQLLPILGCSFFMFWHAFQCLLVYKGINLKDFVFAQRVVILMKWYMVATTLFFLLLFFIIDPVFWIPQLEQINGVLYAIVAFFIILLAEVIFFFLFLYGTLNVRKLLKEMEDILEGANYFGQPL